MKTNMNQTSLMAYEAIRETLSAREREVFEAIKVNGPLTREQIAAATGMKESGACGRVASLLEHGLVKRNGTIKNPVTNKSNELIALA